MLLNTSVSTKVLYFEVFKFTRSDINKPALHCKFKCLCCLVSGHCGLRGAI